MKNFVKNWIVPPKIWNLLLYFKSKRLIHSKEHFIKNLELKNIHRNERCFIIGLGNSINNQDLKLMKNEIIIGVSGLFTHDDIKAIMPTYYVLSPVFKYHGHLNKEENYIAWLKAMDAALDDNVIMMVHISDKPYLDQYKIFGNKKVYWNDYINWNGDQIKEFELHNIPSINSVSEAALSIALYLGFKKIYILGFDHTWYEKNDNHFDNTKVFQYFKKSQRDLNLEFKWDSETHMRNHANIFKKYKALYQLKQNIFNANANEDTYVDTFPKVRYEDLFNYKGK